MDCKACKARGKTWSGSNPVCSFPKEVFDKTGWNCATANELRDLMETEGNFKARRNDGSIGLLYVPERINNEGDYVAGDFWILGLWYKERGRTDGLFSIGLGSDTAAIQILTTELAELALEILKEEP